MMNVGGKEARDAAQEINLLLVEALRNANYNPQRLFAERVGVDAQGGWSMK
ncbi:MAG: hypothetical protein KAS36_14385 [Anaerolineales bacterium]|nr:hypothetical protein [Anaerolineales bacterium]